MNFGPIGGEQTQGAIDGEEGAGLLTQVSERVRSATPRFGTCRRRRRKRKFPAQRSSRFLEVSDANRFRQRTEFHEGSRRDSRRIALSQWVDLESRDWSPSAIIGSRCSLRASAPVPLHGL